MPIFLYLIVFQYICQRIRNESIGIMKYASFKMWIADKYHYKEGYAIGLVVRKNNKRKVMALGIYAEPHQWNDKLEMFVTDKRVPKLHPDRIYLNEWLTQKKSEKLKLIKIPTILAMAMTLQDNQVPREVISQILGHSDLATTNTYLDSFASSIIDETVKVL